MLQAHFSYGRGVIGDGVFNLRGSGFVLACRFPLQEYWVVVDLFCDLDLDPMTFIYELDPYPVEINRICKHELPTSKLLKVIV